jgi:MFS family permease
MFAVAALIVLVLAVLWVGRAELAVPETKAAKLEEGAAKAQGSRFGFLRLPAVWACFVFFLVYSVALGGVQSFAPAAAGQLHGVATTQLAACVSAYMAAAALGMVIGGHLVRNPQHSARIVALGFGIAAAVALLIAFGRWPAAVVPALFGAMGLGAGIAGPSRDLLVKQATPPGATGRVYGVVYSGLDVGMMLAPLLFGALMDAGAPRGVWLGMAAAQLLLIANAFNVGRRRPVPQPA